MSVNEEGDTDPYAAFLSSRELLLLDKDHLLHQEYLEDDPALMYKHKSKYGINPAM